MNLFGFLIGRAMAESGGAPAADANRIALVCSTIPSVFGLVVAASLGRAAAPPPAQDKSGKD
jgi:hypothetical protein